jgi:hypothetical protein
MLTIDEMSDDPEELRRQMAAALLGHCLLMAHHHKAGWRTLVPDWPVRLLTTRMVAPAPLLSRDELDRLPFGALITLIYDRLEAHYPNVLPDRGRRPARLAPFMDWIDYRSFANVPSLSSARTDTLS